MISIRREVLTNPPKMSGCARAALLIDQLHFREAEKKTLFFLFSSTSLYVDISFF